MTVKKRVLFLCVNNSCRSQMAEGILRHYGGDSYEAFSAGSEPTMVNENAIRALKEVRIDISGQYSKSMDEFAGDKFDCIITTCEEAKDACPVMPGDAKMIHLNLNDPAKAKGSEEETLNAFRATRDEITDFIRKFIIT